MDNKTRTICLLCGREYQPVNKQLSLDPQGYSLDAQCFKLFRKFVTIYGNDFINMLIAVK